MAKYAGFLRERFEGAHGYGSGTTDIRRVVALPQPLASLLMFMRRYPSR